MGDPENGELSKTRSNLVFDTYKIIMCCPVLAQKTMLNRKLVGGQLNSIQTPFCMISVSAPANEMANLILRT